MLNLLILSDLELTEAKISSAESVFNDLASTTNKSSYEALIFAGDLFEEFTPATAHCAYQCLSKIKAERKYIMLGNHDYASGKIDKVTGNFHSTPDSDFHVITKPCIQRIGNLEIAFLPAPNIPHFRAKNKNLTKQELNQKVSKALENALKYLNKTVEDVSNAFLVCHGTPEGAVFPSGKTSLGLTWDLPIHELKKWAHVFVGHIHKPFTMADGKITNIGGMMQWEFGQGIDDKKAYDVQVKGPDFNINPITLFKPNLMIETEIDDSKVEIKHDAISENTGTPGVNGRDEIEFIGRKINEILENQTYGFDKIWIKIRYKLPEKTMHLVPDIIKAGEILAPIIGKNTIYNLKIVKERIASREIRLDTTGGFSINNYFRQWCELNSISIPDESDVIEKVIQQYQAQLPESGTFSFRPILMKAENAFQWKDLEIDFSQWKDIIAITGKNAKGKSSILDILLFNLFKKSPKAKTLDKFINNQKQTARTELVFESGGDIYRVRHALKRSKKGASCNSSLDIKSGGSWQPFLTDARKFKESITDLVSSYEFFTSTMIGTQRDIGKIIDATPTDWADLILESRALNIFNDMKTDMKELEYQARNIRQTAGSRIKLLDEQITENKRALRSLENVSDSKAKIISDKIHDMKIYKDNAEKQLADISHKIIETNNALEEKSRLIDESTILKRDILELKGKCNITIDEKEKPGISSKQLRIDLEDAQKGLNQETAELRELEDRISHKKISVVMAEDNIQTLKQNIKAGMDKAQALKEKRDSLAVPCDDLMDDKSVSLKYSCEAYNLVTDKKLIDRTIKKVNENKKQIESAIRHIKETKASLKESENRFIKQSNVVKDLKNQVEKINADLIKTGRDEQEYHDYLKELERIEFREKELADRESRLVKITEKLESLIDVADAEKLGKLKLKKDELISSINNINDDIHVKEAEFLDIKSKINTFSELEKTIKRDMKRKKISESDHAKNWNYEKAYELLVKAFDRKGGIPYLIMETSVDSIESVVNSILTDADVDITVQFDTVSTIQSGETRDQITVSFTDQNGCHDLCALSGYQEAVVGMAIRAALAITGSDFWGIAPELFIQDEGWDRFHKTAYPIAGKLIQAIHKHFKRFIFITHITELAQNYATINYEIITDKKGNPKVVVNG